jgi:hypothetical protein
MSQTNLNLFTADVHFNTNHRTPGDNEVLASDLTRACGSGKLCAPGARKHTVNERGYVFLVPDIFLGSLGNRLA